MNAVGEITLVDVLLERAGSARCINIIKGQDQHQRIAYSNMLERAKRRLAQFQVCGLKAGTQLIIQTTDNAAFLEAFWACLLGGITAVPLSGGNSAEHRLKLFRIATKLEQPGLYTDQENHTRLTDFASANGLDDSFADLSERYICASFEAPESTLASVHQPSPDDVAFIQFSSGSTSTPKGVVLSHRNLIVNTRAIITGCDMSEQDHLFSWMPLTHDMGLIGFHLTPLVRDVDQSLMPTDVFVRRPALWLTEAAKVGATMLCSPNFGYQHVLKSFKPEKHSTLDLSSVRLVFNGAEPISVPLCERFMRTMAPFSLSADAMCPVYGLAEASLAVTFPVMESRFQSLIIDRRMLGIEQEIQILDSSQAETGVSFVSVGKPVQDVSVQIRNDSGQVLDDNVTGLICIRGDNVTKGYYKEVELNREIISTDGWLNTGDLGFLHEGLLYITGRAKDIIFVNGQNVYPHDLEEIVMQAELVERGKLAISSCRMPEGDHEQLVVFILHRGDPADLLDTGRSITKLLSESAGVPVHLLVPVNRIPKTTSGKIQRFLLIASLNAGEFTPLMQAFVEPSIREEDELLLTVDSATASVVSDLDTASTLLVICNAEVEGIEVTVDDNLFELGISSLTLAQIHAAIEEKWPDQVDITDLFDYPTVAELAVFLDGKNSA
ncbi:MAG: acyl-CoA synthetase (AMP-forming)/AMP-acid ligase II/acyl carrier protein [Granulosicoccus sp.]|jgi:acyl-CoA synthetase (AMP-forming)/AMP-acid ligase II/acyl carrier protein